MAIASIRHKGLKQLFQDGNRKGVPAEFADKLERMLTVLHFARTIDEIDRNRSRHSRSLFGTVREIPGCEEEPLLRSTPDGALELSDPLRADTSGVALALERDLRGDQGSDRQVTLTIDAPIPRSTRYLHSFEAERLQEVCTESLEGRGRNLLQMAKDFRLSCRFSGSTNLTGARAAA